MTTFSAGNLKTLRFALPTAFLVSFLFTSVDFLRILSFLFTTIPLHEMGHALAAWMGGRWAVPLGAIVPTAGMTLISDSRSTFFIILFFGLLAAGIYRAFTMQYRFHLNLLLLTMCRVTNSVHELHHPSFPRASLKSLHKLIYIYFFSKIR